MSHSESLGKLYTLLERARRALTIAYLDQRTEQSAQESFLTAQAIEDFQIEEGIRAESTAKQELRDG